MNRRLVSAVLTTVALLGVPAQAMAAANKNSKFCKTARDLSKMDDLFGDDWDPTANPKESVKQLNKASVALKNLEKDAPSTVKGDIVAIRGFFDKFAKVLPKWPTGPSATDPAKLAKVLTDLTPLLADIGKLEPRVERLTKVFSTDCGLKL